MASIKDRFLNYFRGRKFGWWFWNGLFAAVVVVFLVPSWRMQVQVWMNGMFLSSPSLDNPGVSLSTEEWKLLTLDQNREPDILMQHKGTPVFINFWATWCPPCVAEMKSIEDLYKKHGDKVKFYLITSQTQEVVEGFMSQRELDIPYHYLAHEPAGIFQVTSYPTTIIISRTGEVVAHERGAADWSAENVDKLLTKLVQSDGE